MSRFRLEAVRQVREAARDEKRAHLAEALQAEAVVAEQLEHVSQDLKTLHLSSRQEVAPGTVNMDQLVRNTRHRARLQAHQQQLNAQLEQIQDEIDRRRDLLAQADQDVKVIEKLAEAHASRVKQRAAQREQMELDDLSLINRRNLTVDSPTRAMERSQQ